MGDGEGGQPQSNGGSVVEVRRRTPGEARAYAQGVRGGLDLATTALRHAFDCSCGSCNGCGCSAGPHDGACPDGTPRCPDCDATGNPAIAIVERERERFVVLNGAVQFDDEHRLKGVADDLADGCVLLRRFARLVDPDNGPSTDEERLALMEFMSRSMALLEAVQREVEHG